MFRFRLSKSIPNLVTAILLIALFALPDLAMAATNCSDTTQDYTVFLGISCTTGIRQSWWAVLALTDFLVVGGLIAAAYGNIFHLKLDSYELKKMLPGLVIGVILANLSFFIMQFLIETATMSVDFIGTIYKGMLTGGADSTQAAFPYILEQTIMKLLYSLRVSTVDGQIHNSVQFISSITQLVGGGIISILAMILVPIVGLIFCYVLVFLLFIRNYVLAVLFIVSPIAFFAAGVPAFKSWFDKFWGVLSQWLIMAPITAAVFGLAAVYYQNISNAGLTNPDTHKNIFDYLFYNGVGLAIIYYAIRLPFIISAKAPVFGQDVMKKWSDAGRYVGKEGSKGAWDLGGKGLAKLKNPNSKITSFLSDAAETAKRGKIERAMPLRTAYRDAKGVDHAAEDPTDYKTRIDREYMRQRRASQAGTYATKNPWRQGVALGQVYQNFRKERPTNDEILTKKTDANNYWSPKLTPATFAAEQSKRFQEEVKESEDIPELFAKFNKIREAADRAGFSEADKVKISKAALDTKKFDKLLDSDHFAGLKDQIKLMDLVEAAENGQQLRAVYRRQRRPFGGRVEIDAMVGLDNTTGGFITPQPMPYAPGSRSGAAPYTGTPPSTQPPTATAGVVAQAPQPGAPRSATGAPIPVQAVAAPVPSVASMPASTSAAPSGQSALDIEKNNLAAKRSKENNATQNDFQGELVQAVSNLGEQVGQMAGETAAIASRSAATAAPPSINVQVNTGAGQDGATAPSVIASTPLGTPVTTTSSSGQDATQPEEPSASSGGSSSSVATNQPVQGINVTPASPSIENIVVPTPIGKPINSSDVRSAQSGTFDPEAPQA